ncbi:hypothetical protein DTW90_30745 [Neorhizobium sp. P12A]|uniref:Ig domain-containing protein n=1 Tax=Neorhizobium sp. P12A TaxID=2268027 RepID=UPI0011EF0FD6|nr:Ig domain-containing protein [Neorhizobium sp. P12A]KAA0689871.1 hypothetical protein DTW90_30745 [Neorhizobium sp. P12A]
MTGLRTSLRRGSALRTLAGLRGGSPSQGGGAPSIGGIPIGAPGAVGTIYENYTLSGGDDYNSAPAIVSPSTPAADYFSSRSYILPAVGQTARSARGGSITLKGYDVDAMHTGFMDINRGQPVSTFNDLMQTSSSALALKSRAATAPEKLMGDGCDIISSMLDTVGLIVGRPPCIIEAKIRIRPGYLAQREWHPSFWLMLAGPASSYTSLEFDWEATDTANPDTFAPNNQKWTTGSSNPIDDNGNPAYAPNLWDGNWHTIGFIVGTANVQYTVDGVVVKTTTVNTAQQGNRPFYALLTNHVADFQAKYNLAAWQGQGNPGNVFETDFIRVWRTTAGTHRTPLIANNAYNVDFNTPFSFAQPTAAALWGDGAVNETFEAIVNEVIAPGGNVSGGWIGLPAGITYTGGNLAGTVSDKAGRLYFVRTGTKLGETCKPQRVAINVGPNLSNVLINIGSAAGSKYDLYAAVDVGDLVPATISVTGLPSGLTFNTTTGLITNDGSAVVSSFTASVTATNAVGQSATSTVNGAVVAGTPLPVVAGLAGSLDPDNAATVTSSGGLVSAIAGADGSSQAATQATGGLQPSLVTKRSRGALLFGSGKFMDWTGIASFLNGGVGTMAIVAELNTLAAAACMLEIAQAAAATTANRLEILCVTGGTSWTARKCGPTGTFIDASDPNAAPLATPTCIIARFKTATATKMYHDRYLFTAAAGTPDVGATMDQATLGARRASGGTVSIGLEGWIYRAAVFNAELTDKQIYMLGRWAAQNWGTP